MQVCCRWLSLLLGVAVLLQGVPTAYSVTTSMPTDSGSGGDCMPAISSQCFAGVAMDLDLKRAPVPANSSVFRYRDAVDMCYTLDDALNCTSDIIDGDCSASAGHLTYDGWLRGLRSVQSHLCGNNATIMRALIQPNPCWDLAQYLVCMEDDAHIHQPMDMMNVKLDARECSGIQRASAECAVQAATSRCGPGSTPSAALHAALHAALSAFLLETPCLAVCWQLPGPQPGQFGSGAVIAIVLLTVLTLILATALALVTYRTSCFRIPIARG